MLNFLSQSGVHSSARLAHIRSFGAEIVFSPQGEYVSGVIEHLRLYLRERKLQGRPVFCTNHAESEYSVKGMEEGGKEIVKDLEAQSISNINFYFSALGGGINLSGFARILLECWPDMAIIGVEPFEAPDNYVRRFPGRFEATYGYQPRMQPHGLLGIGRWGDASYKFPYIEQMLKRVDDIVLVNEESWFEIALQLRDLEAKHVGRTSAACLWAALEFAKEVREKIFVLTFYDPAWKYLDFA